MRHPVIIGYEYLLKLFYNAKLFAYILLQHVIINSIKTRIFRLFTFGDLVP